MKRDPLAGSQQLILGLYQLLELSVGTMEGCEKKTASYLQIFSKPKVATKTCSSRVWQSRSYTYKCSAKPWQQVISTERSIAAFMSAWKVTDNRWQIQVTDKLVRH